MPAVRLSAQKLQSGEATHAEGDPLACLDDVHTGFAIVDSFPRVISPNLVRKAADVAPLPKGIELWKRRMWYAEMPECSGGGEAMSQVGNELVARAIQSPDGSDIPYIAADVQNLFKVDGEKEARGSNGTPIAPVDCSGNYKASSDLCYTAIVMNPDVWGGFGFSKPNAEHMEKFVNERGRFIPLGANALAALGTSRQRLAPTTGLGDGIFKPFMALSDIGPVKQLWYMSMNLGTAGMHNSSLVMQLSEGINVFRSVRQLPKLLTVPLLTEWQGHTNLGAELVSKYLSPIKYISPSMRQHHERRAKEDEQGLKQGALLPLHKRRQKEEDEQGLDRGSLHHAHYTGARKEASKRDLGEPVPPVYHVSYRIAGSKQASSLLALRPQYSTKSNFFTKLFRLPAAEGLGQPLCVHMQQAHARSQDGTWVRSFTNRLTCTRYGSWNTGTAGPTVTLWFTISSETQPENSSSSNMTSTTASGSSSSTPPKAKQQRR